jgi:transcriptional regulator with XRE-family HTH domain
MLKDNLARLLEIQEIKVAPLSSKAGLNKETVAQILLGNSKNPGVYTVAKIADVLGISVDELIGRKTITTKKTKNAPIKNLALLHKVSTYIINSLKKRTLKPSIDVMLEGIKEVYKVSTSKDKFDKELADWYIETYF